MKTKILFLTLFVITGLNACRQGASEQNKKEPFIQIADTISAKASAGGMKMILATIHVKPGREADFTEAFKVMEENSNKEEGCLFYKLYQDPYDKSSFIVVERYRNQAAIDYHFGTDYFKAFGPNTADLVASPAEIKIYDISESE